MSAESRSRHEDGIKRARSDDKNKKSKSRRFIAKISLLFTLRVFEMKAKRFYCSLIGIS